MKLVNHLNHLKTNELSIEVCSEKPLDLDLLCKVNALYYSVTWHTNLKIDINDDFTKIPAFHMASLVHQHTNSILLHMPCRYFEKETIFKALTFAKETGIENILALYGETQKSQQNSPDFLHAIDLVAYIRANFERDFCVGVAGYPSTHPRATSPELDLMHLKQKIDAGADFIITQAIFDIEVFHTFYKNCRAIGITVHIIPGIYIIKTYNDLLAMSKLCKITMPDSILKPLEPIKDDNEMVHNFGISYARDLMKNLLNNSEYPVNNVHIFSLNNIEHVVALCKNVHFE